MGAASSREKTALTAGFALGAGSFALWRALQRKNEPSLRCPATEWPAGAPLRTTEYPAYDLSDKKGSFLKVCDRLIEEVVAELPAMYALPPRETAWVREMLEYNTKGGKMNRGLMVVECGAILYQAKGARARARRRRGARAFCAPRAARARDGDARRAQGSS